MRKLTFLCIFLSAVFLFANCRKNQSDLPDSPVTIKPVAIDFTIADSSIVVNPNGFTPLSAQVTFNSIKEGRTFIRVHGRHGALSDVTHLFNDAGLTHSIPVIGMYADTTNAVDIRIVDNDGDTLAESSIAITTQTLPANMPTSITALPFDEGAVEPGLFLVSSLSTYRITDSHQASVPYMLDNYGDIRWLLDYSSSNSELDTMFYDDGIARLRNGNFYFGNSYAGRIYEVDLLGNVINTWNMPGYLFHHNVQEKPNGNFLVTASKANDLGATGLPVVEDYILEIDRTSKSIINTWDLKQSLNELRQTLTPNTIDWFHGNSVIYDSTDNTIVVSGRTQGVVKLDYNNKVKWILGPHVGWGKNGRGESLDSFLLTPVDAGGNIYADQSIAAGAFVATDFEWPFYQHSNIYLPNGDLMVFDNGTSRNFDFEDGNNVYNTVPGKYSRAVEYKIDETKKTIQQVWEYGKDRGQACYSSIISSVQYLPEKNHILFCPGFNVLNTTGLGGKIVEVDYATKQVVSEISISTANVFAFHRAKKISAYPDNL